MRFTRLALMMTIVVALFAALFVTNALPLAAQTTTISSDLSTSLPDSNPNSGRFVNLTQGFKSLGEAGTHFEVVVSPDMPGNQFMLEIFDGVMGQTWDNWTAKPANPPQTMFTLYADATMDQTNLTQLAAWNSSVMPDNDWWSTTVANTPAALASTGPYAGNYIYHLQVDWASPSTLPANAQNDFKLQAQGQIIALGTSAYGFEGFNDAGYPLGFGFDGSFALYLDVPDPAQQLDFWTGDFDQSPNSKDVGSPDYPPFSYNTVVTCPQGGNGSVSDPLNINNSADCTGNVTNDGRPQDNTIHMQVTAPDGSWTVVDDNVSGNQEWKRFRLQVDSSLTAPVANTPAAVGDPDFFVPSLPAGQYKWEVLGAQSRNTLFVYPGYQVLAPAPAQLGDYVWNDLNQDGLQQDGEPGIPSVTVTLTDADGNPVTDASGNPVNPVTTDANGLYSFTNLVAGQYKVQFTAPSGYTFTLQYAPDGVAPGQNPDTDSNAAVSGITDVITLAAGQTDNSIDAGLYVPAAAPAQLGDYVWNDLNQDGLQQDGEPGIPSVTVTLTDADGNPVTDASGNPVNPVTTDANGLYSFTNLVAGQYKVQFTAPSGYTFTLQYAPDGVAPGQNPDTDSNAAVSGITDVITLAAGQTDNSIDAGLYKPTGCDTNLCAFIRTPCFWKSYSDVMTEAQFASVLHATQDYSNLTVAQALAILKNNNDSFHRLLLSAELNAAWNGDKTNPGPGGALGLGVYTYSGSSYNGRTVNSILHEAFLLTGKPSADLQDTVEYLGSAGGSCGGTNDGGCGGSSCSGTDCGESGCSGTDCGGKPKCDCRVVVAGCVVPPESTAALGNLVWYDMNRNGKQDRSEPGVPGVKVTLLDSQGHVLATTITAANGGYGFSKLLPGTYWVRFTAPRGFTFSPQYQGRDTAKDSNANIATGVTDGVTLTEGQVDKTIDAGLYRKQGCTPGKQSGTDSTACRG